jgi:hypothetical protein
MTVVVDTNAVVNPGAVARESVSGCSASSKLGNDILIVLCNTSLASLAVLASEWRPDHAGYAKVGLIKLPQAQKFIDNGLLLCNTVHFWNESRVKYHAGCIKVSTQSIGCRKCKIQQRVVGERAGQDSQEPSDTNKEQGTSEYTRKPWL